jgi:hypothetical protein
MSSRVALASLSTLVLSCLAACGGEDGPRPQREDTATVVGAVDYCPLLQAHDYQMLLDFSKSPLGLDANSCPPDSSGTRKVYANYESSGVLLDPSLIPSPDPNTAPKVFPIEGGLCGQAVNAANILVKRAALKPPADNPPDAGPYAPGLGGWGATLNIDCSGLDASAWEGLSFFLKRGPNGAGQTTSVTVPDNTLSTSGCIESGAMDVRNMCDAYGFSVGFDDQWRFFVLPFAEMRQRGYGMPYARELFMSSGLTSLVRLKLEFAPSDDWDIWFARVALYKSK